jgi:pyruvate dehydrogenase E2 component (dihydrolipoamide acetyltransferase)
VAKQFEAVTIPKWGIEMTEGRIVEWRIAEGDAVAAGDELVDIETDKIVNSFEARESGTLARLVVPEGEELPVGTLIGVIALGDYTAEEVDAFIAQHTQGEGDEKTGPDNETAVDDSSDIPAAAATANISPALRRKLAGAGIDPCTVTGSGIGGRIIKADVDRAMQAASQQPPVISTEASLAAVDQGITALQSVTALTGGRALSSAQQKVAAQLSSAQATVPLYHIRRSLQIGPALRHLEAELPGQSGLLTLLLIRGLSAALQKQPMLNVQFKDNEMRPIEGANVAVAVAREDGAVAAPVIRSPYERPLVHVAKDLAEAITRAKAGRLTADDMAPAAVTLSNLGMFGVDEFTAMVTPPQVMVVSVGRVVREPVWDDGLQVFIPRDVIHANLGSDHRIVNGAEGAQFMRAFADAIEG